MAKRTTGIVRWFDGSKGYGYIDSQDGENVFVHHTAIIDQEFSMLTVGEQVTFYLEMTVRGPQASELSRLS